MFYKCVKVAGVLLALVEVYFLLVEEGHDQKLGCTMVLSVRNSVRHSVIIYRNVGFRAHMAFRATEVILLDQFWVSIENISFCVLRWLRWINKIISQFYHLVSKIKVTINQRIQTKPQPSDIFCFVNYQLIFYFLTFNIENFEFVPVLWFSVGIFYCFACKHYNLVLAKIKVKRLNGFFHIFLFIDGFDFVKVETDIDLFDYLSYILSLAPLLLQEVIQVWILLEYPIIRHILTD